MARRVKYPANRHPLKLQARQRLIKETAAEFESRITTIKLKIYAKPDGEDAAELLAALAVVIGSKAQAGGAVHEHGQPWVRQLHGALHIIRDVCLHGGYRWDASQAAALERAVEIAAEDHPEIPPDVFFRAFLEANALAADIENHRLAADTIL